MNEEQNNNENNNNRFISKQLKEMNLNDLLINDNEINKSKENNQFNINNDELEIYSPEYLQNLLCKNDTNSNNNTNKQKKEIKEKKDNKNIKKKVRQNLNVINRKKKKDEIINFEDLLIRKRNEEKNKSKNKNNNRSEINNNKKKNNKRIDFSGRLYQPKKKYYLTEEDIIKKEKNKSKSKEKNFNDIKRNKSAITHEFKKFSNKKYHTEFTPKRKEEENKINKNKIKTDNKKIINEFLMRNVPKKDDERRKRIEKDKNLRENIRINLSRQKPLKSAKSQKKNVQFVIKNINNRKLSHSNENKRNKLINDYSSFKENKMKQKKKGKRYRNIKNENVPNRVVETEIDLAIKNKINFHKEFTPIKNKSIKFDNSKYEKFNTEKIRYNLMKEYSNLKPNKENGFLRRMQFYSLKRKKNLENINKIIEKNKFKIEKSERDKTFNRLIEDAQRRTIQKNKLLEEKKLNEEEINNNRKYNEKEWNKIYDTRFKEYEKYKIKKMEIEREKEKIEKMIEEIQSNMNRINIISNNKIFQIQENSIINDEKEIFNIINQSENELNNSQNINNINVFQSYDMFKNGKNRGNN